MQREAVLVRFDVVQNNMPVEALLDCPIGEHRGFGPAVAVLANVYVVDGQLGHVLPLSSTKTPGASLST